MKGPRHPCADATCDLHHALMITKQLEILQPTDGNFQRFSADGTCTGLLGQNNRVILVSCKAVGLMRSYLESRELGIVQFRDQRTELRGRSGFSRGRCSWSEVLRSRLVVAVRCSWSEYLKSGFVGANLNLLAKLLPIFLFASC